jgi:hypothetical protein
MSNTQTLDILGTLEKRQSIERQTTRFINYLMDFYGPNGVYPIPGFNETEALRCMAYRFINRPDMPFEGDSSDREEAIRFYQYGNNEVYVP